MIANNSSEVAPIAINREIRQFDATEVILGNTDGFLQG